jgi:hypothetical protein
MNSVASLATCLIDRAAAHASRDRAQVGSSTQGGAASAGTHARSEAASAIRLPSSACPSGSLRDTPAARAVLHASPLRSPAVPRRTCC